MKRTAVRGSRTGRPIMALLDLMGRRWAMRIVWELRDTHLTFRALQAACDGVSPTVLNDRLRELREAALVAVDPERGYGLSDLGRIAALDRLARPPAAVVSPPPPPLPPAPPTTTAGTITTPPPIPL